MSDPRIEQYEWSGGREAVLRFGPDEGPLVILALPLFEEANRTRAFGVTLLRALAARGIGGMLPELPAQGESSVPTEQTTLFQLREAIEAVVDRALGDGRICHAVGIRSGALLDAFALFSGRWHLAAQQGEDVLRDLLRLGKASGEMRREADAHGLIGAASPVRIAGNAISAAMAADLQCADTYDQPGVPLRTVRLRTDPSAADIKVDGPPLWRRAEPDNDPAFAALLADDIAVWIATCA